MLKKIVQLAKVLRKCANDDGEDTGGEEAVAVAASPQKIFLPVFGLAVAGGLFFLTNHFAELITTFGGAGVLLPAIFFLAGIVCLFFTFIELVNTLYMSSELTALITMPYSAFEIVFARIINTFFKQYVLSALLILPACLGYGLAASLSGEFYLTVGLGLILIPMFCIFAMAAIVILIMSFVRVFRNKDVLTVVGIICVFLLMVAYILVTDNNNGSELGDMALVAMQSVSGMTNFIPIAAVLTNFYSSGNFLFILAAIGLVLLAFGILLIFIRLFYVQGALAMHTGSTRGGIVKNLRAALHKRSVVSALTRKELRLIFRTPAFMLNGWIMAFFWPMLLILPMVFKMNITLPEEFSMQAIAEALSFMHPLTTVIVCVIAFSVSSMVLALNNLAYNALSREGQSFFVTKTVPVDYKKQIIAKRNATLFVCGIGSTIYTMIFSIIVIFIGFLPIWSLLPIFITSFATLVLGTDIQMWLGSRGINLEWSDEATIGKQTSIIFILVAMAAAIGIPIVIFINLSAMPPLVWGGIIVAAIVLLAIIVNFLTVRSMERKMERISD